MSCKGCYYNFSGVCAWHSAGAVDTYGILCAKLNGCAAYRAEPRFLEDSIDCCGLTLSREEFEEFQLWLDECCGMSLSAMIQDGNRSLITRSWSQYQDELFGAENE